MTLARISGVSPLNTSYLKTAAINERSTGKVRTQKEAETAIDTLELKTGEKIKVNNGACMEAESQLFYQNSKAI